MTLAGLLPDDEDVRAPDTDGPRWTTWNDLVRIAHERLDEEANRG